jgi:hypothetical protein
LVGADLQNAGSPRRDLNQLFCANARKALEYNKAFRFPQAINDLAPLACRGGAVKLIAT